MPSRNANGSENGAARRKYKFKSWNEGVHSSHGALVHCGGGDHDDADKALRRRQALQPTCLQPPCRVRPLRKLYTRVYIYLSACRPSPFPHPSSSHVPSTMYYIPFEATLSKIDTFSVGAKIKKKEKERNERKMRMPHIRCAGYAGKSGGSFGSIDTASKQNINESKTTCGCVNVRWGLLTRWYYVHGAQTLSNCKSLDAFSPLTHSDSTHVAGFTTLRRDIYIFQFKSVSCMFL